MGENNTNKDGKAQDLDTFLKKMKKKLYSKIYIIEIITFMISISLKTYFRVP